MKKLGILVFSTILLICLSACKNGFTQKNKGDMGTVKLNIQKGSRTISPFLNDWYLQNIDEWTVIFTRNDGAEQVHTMKLKPSEFPKEISLVEGTYNISITSSLEMTPSADLTPRLFTISGKLEDVPVTSGTIIEKTIYVSLEINDGDTGRFSYSIIFASEEFKDEVTEEGTAEVSGSDTTDLIIGEYYFNASLTKVSNSENVIPLKLTYSEEDGMKFDLFEEEIPAGYYYLSFEYKKGDAAEFKPLDAEFDRTVYIYNELSSENQITINNNPFTSKTKTLYVDNNGVNNTGYIPQNCKDLSKTFEMLSDDSTWETANLYFIKTNIAGDSVTDEAYHKSIAPCIDIHKVPDTVDKIINIYVDSEDPILTIQNEKFYLGTYYENCEIMFSSNNKSDIDMVTLELVEDSYIYCPNFYLDNTYLLIEKAEYIYQNTSAITIYGNVGTEYSDHGFPFLRTHCSTTLSEEKINNISNKNVYYIDASGNNNKFITRAERDELFVDYYPDLAGEAGIKLGSAVPKFCISGDTEVEPKDADITYTAVPLMEGRSFSEGTTYTWKVNGVVVENDNEDKSVIKINFSKLETVWKGDNTITCIANNGNVYESAITKVKIRYTPIPVALYHGGYPVSKRLYQYDLNELADRSFEVSYNAYGFYDYTYDNHGNLYVIRTDDDCLLSYSCLDTETEGENKYDCSDISNKKLYYDMKNDILYLGTIETIEGTEYFIIRAFSNPSENEFTEESCSKYTINVGDLTKVDDFAVLKTADTHIAYVSTKSSEADSKYTTSHIYTASLVINDSVSFTDTTGIDLVVPGQTIIEFYSIADITIVNDKVYVLINERKNNSDSYVHKVPEDISAGYSEETVEQVSNKVFYSRGALVMLDPSDNNSITRYGYYQNPVLYIQDDTTSLAEHRNKYFFAPVKFVAVVPKKLVIAEDGAFAYKDPGYGVDDVNRIVVVNLEDETFGFEKDIDIENLSFDYDSNKGCDFEDSGFYPNY